MRRVGCTRGARRLGAVLALAAAACVRPPVSGPLAGEPAPARLPAVELGASHRRVVFEWEATDPDLVVRGEGLARIAPPDSARVDLFLAGGFGGGRAFLIGDTIEVPGAPVAKRYLPPPPMLWAAFGRLSVPAAPDTVARVDGDTLRADIGRDPRWRVTLAKGRLVRLERIEGDRRRAWVSRSPSGRVDYRDEEARRSLTITVTTSEDAAPFDASVWPPPR